MGEDDSTESIRPEQSSDAASLRPAPPARGWYRIPDNPNYEHFWDGQKWTSQRYWGGASSGGNESPYGGPPVADPQSFDLSPLREGDSTPHAGPPGQALFNAADAQGYAPEERFYAVTTFVVPPVFIAFFALFALSDIPHKTDRPFGMAAAVLAALMVVFFLQRPFVAIVRRDGSLTFKSLIGSKETTVSRVSRIGVATGNRGGSSWIFYFDGTRAVLGDIGGLRLKRYLIARNPRLG